MWKAMFVPLLVVLVIAPVYADYASECPDVRSGCSAEYIRTTEKSPRGKKCGVKVETGCETFASASQGCISSSSIYGQNGTCREISVTQDVECWAKAAASAFASASVVAQCKGRGKACVEVKAEADATACAVAKAITDIAVTTGKDKDPACQAQIMAFLDATVSVSANAMASACARKNRPGMAKDFEFSSDVKSVISRAFGACWVYCKELDNGEQEVTTEAKGAAAGEDVTPPETSINT